MIREAVRGDPRNDGSAKRGGLPKTIVTKTPKKVQTVEAFLHFLKNFMTLDNLFSFFAPGALFIAEDVTPIAMKKFADLVSLIHEAFPNMYFVFGSMKDDERDVVVVESAHFRVLTQVRPILACQRSWNPFPLRESMSKWTRSATS